MGSFWVVTEMGDFYPSQNACLHDRSGGWLPSPVRREQTHGNGLPIYFDGSQLVFFIHLAHADTRDLSVSLPVWVWFER